jgi:pantetheine-phosphate adenylyltransferase
MANHEYQFIASRLVKEIAQLNGDIRSFVSAPVAERLLDRVKLT